MDFEKSLQSKTQGVQKKTSVQKIDVKKWREANKREEVLKTHLSERQEKKISNEQFLVFRKRIADIQKMSDVFLISSLRRKQFSGLLFKEFCDVFLKQNFYIALLFLSVLSGIFIYQGMDALTYVRPVDWEMQMWSPHLGNIHFILLFFIPILTMSSLGVELKGSAGAIYRRAGIKSFDLLISKFCIHSLAAIIFVSACTLPLIGWALIKGISLLPMAIGFAALNAAAILLISLGLLSSALTERPATAFLLHITLELILIFSFILGQMAANPMIGEILMQFSLGQHLSAFTRGTIRSYDVSYYIIGILMSLFSASIALNIRQKNRG